MRKNPAPKIKLLLVDDHTILRKGLKLLIEGESNFMIAGEASTGKEAIEVCMKVKPDIVLLDITLPDMNGMMVAKRILGFMPDMKIIVLTMHESEEYFREFLSMGAKGYVAKKAADSELLEAIRTVAGGNMYIHSAMAKAMRERPKVSLSSREKEVIACLAKGFVNKETAARLGISVKTVETYRARIMQKLKMSKRSELTEYAFKTGLTNT